MVDRVVDLGMPDLIHATEQVGSRMVRLGLDAVVFEPRTKTVVIPRRVEVVLGGVHRALRLGGRIAGEGGDRGGGSVAGRGDRVAGAVVGRGSCRGDG